MRIPYIYIHSFPVCTCTCTHSILLLIPSFFCCFMLLYIHTFVLLFQFAYYTCCPTANNPTHLGKTVENIWDTIALCIVNHNDELLSRFVSTYNNYFLYIIQQEFYHIAGFFQKIFIHIRWVFNFYGILVLVNFSN